MNDKLIDLPQNAIVFHKTRAGIQNSPLQNIDAFINYQKIIFYSINNIKRVTISSNGAVFFYFFFKNFFASNFAENGKMNLLYLR